MTRAEMLQKLGLSETEHQDLVKKTVGFLNSLDSNQKRSFISFLPTIEEAAKFFGPDTTVQDVKSLATDDALAAGVAFFACKAPGHHR